MKQLLICSNFYGDIEQLTTVITPMSFEDTAYGKEIKDFAFIPEGMKERFDLMTGDNVEIQPKTGIFRRPKDFVHFENFYEHTLWVCIVAFEKTTLKFHRHKESEAKTFYDVEEDINAFAINNSYTLEKWETYRSIELDINDYVFIRPWVWHSLSDSKLVQIFTLNMQLEKGK